MGRFIEGADRRQDFLLPASLDDYVSEDPVRAIEAFIDALDLKALEFAGMRPAETGRPAYYPATMLKIYLYGYLNRVQSSRRLEREAGRNLELMWLTGRLAPDFKTIADFRQANGTAIQAVCSQFIVLCRQFNLFTRAVVAIDGSKMKAVNNRDKNYTAAKVQSRMKQVQDNIDRYLQELDRADREESDVAEPKAARLKEKISSMLKFVAPILVLLATAAIAQTSNANLPSARIATGSSTVCVIPGTAGSSSLCPPQQIVAAGIGAIHAASNAAMAALPASIGSIVRDGYAGAGDAPPAQYAAAPAPCSLNSGAGDGGYQIPTSDSKCWILTPQKRYDVRIWGAKIDGVTNDSAAWAKAASAMSLLKGGTLFVPATGAASLLNTGVTFPNNVIVEGSGQIAWPGLDGSIAQFTATGSWVQCADTVNPCFSLGAGNVIRGLNFIYNQPTPPASGSWSPTSYPYTIYVPGSANFFGIENIGIVAASHCIDIEGPANGVAGIYSYLHNIWFDGCFVRGTKFHLIDNTIHMSNLRYDNWWYADKAPVVTYMEANKVDWDVQYLANAQAEGIEFYQSKTAILFTDGTVGSGVGAVTLSAANMQLANVSFNEVCQALAHAATTTHTSGAMTNVIASGDTGTNCPASNPYFFDFYSDNVDWQIVNLQGSYLQTVARVGGGTNGTLRMLFPRVQKYSAFGAGAAAFVVSAGADLSIPDGLPYIATSAGGGPGVTGAGVYGFQIGGPSAGGYVALAPGSTGATGSLQFYNPSGMRQGYVGQSVNGNLNVAAENGGSIQLNGTVYAPTLPTSCTGKPTGTMWNNANTVSLCP